MAAAGSMPSIEDLGIDDIQDGLAKGSILPVDAHYAGGFLDWVNHGAPVETGS